MSVGNHLIDLDHRLLICKINLIELAMQSPGDEMSNLRLALDELEAYTVEHFDREERLQIAVNYTRFGDHKRLHQELVSRLQEIKSQIMDTESLPRLSEQGPKITELLRDWLMVHVLKEDMKLKPFFLKYPPNYFP
jgi:hemerythrin-like metal-binding protein